MDTVKLCYGLYRSDNNTPIKLKGSKLQIARTYLRENILTIRSITDASMQAIQNSRYELLKGICNGSFVETEAGIFLALQLTERHLELLHKEMKDGCFASKNDDSEDYYGMWSLLESEQLM